MIDLGLPLELASAPPAFTTAAAAGDWLAALSLTHTQQAQTLLARELALLGGTTIAPDERMRIAETLREAVLFVQHEAQRRFAGRPLPLAPAESSVFDACLALWQALETNYLLCLQAGMERYAPDSIALAAQRACSCKCGELAAHCRAGIVPAAAWWHRLHQIYRAIEATQTTLRTVADGLRGNPATTATAAYVEALLLGRVWAIEAGPRQIDLIERWAARWAGKVSVLNSSPREPKTQPLNVDLGGGAPTGEIAAAAADRRWLELSELRKSLKYRLQALAGGATPAELQLGSDCVQPDCEDLLKRLYRCWCKPAEAAPAATVEYELASGFEAIHYFVSGKLFQQPEQGSRLGVREHDEIATFGGIVSQRREEAAHNFATERWLARAGDLPDMSLSKDLAPAGQRLGRDQLIALRPDGAKDFMLAAVRSVRLVAESNRLEAHVRLLPGSPSAVAVRCTGLSADEGRFDRGLRLPALEALQEPASVLTPNGYFRPGRIVELYTDCRRQVRLTRLLSRGTDFERDSFEWE